MLVIVIEGAVCVAAVGWMAGVWRSVHRSDAGTADVPGQGTEDRLRFGVAMDAHGNASGPM